MERREFLARIISPVLAATVPMPAMAMAIPFPTEGPWLFGMRWVMTIKRPLATLPEIYCFADVKFIGKHYELDDAGLSVARSCPAPPMNSVLEPSK